MTTAEAPAPVKKPDYATRPWDNPYFKPLGIPTKERRYVFDCRQGKPVVAACGDGLASNGGWLIDAEFNTKTGKSTVKSATADDKAYEAQNRVGNPWMTYAEVDELFTWADRTGECLRDSFFATYDLKKLNENQKLMVAGAREIFAHKRPESKKKEELARERQDRLDRLLARRAELEPETAEKTARKRREPKAD